MPEASIVELLIKLKDAMSKPAEQAEQKLNRFGKSLQKFEQRSRHIRSLFYAGIAMEGMAWGLAESLKHLAEPAIKFQIAQEDLKRATRLSTAQLAAFERQATQLSDRWPRSAEQITEAQANLIRVLGSAKAAMDTVGIATQFATATQMDLKSSTDLLSTAYENVGNKSLPLKTGFRQLADELTVLQNKFSTSRENGDMLVRSFARLSGMAKISGINTTQMMAALGVLNKSGFAGGRGAADYLQQALDRLGQLGDNGIPTIEKYGIMLAGTVGAHGTFHLNLLRTLRNMMHANPMRLQAYLKTLGQVGGTLKILMGRYAQVTDAVKTFEHAQGATYSLATEMNKGWHQQLEDLDNVWGNLTRTLGQVLVPLLIELAHVLEPVLEWFQRFAKAHTTITKVVFVVGLLLTGMMLLGGAILLTTAAFDSVGAAADIAVAGILDLTEAFWALAASVLADPIFWVIAAVVALGIAAYELVNHWKAVENFFTGLGPLIKRSLIEAWHAVEQFGALMVHTGLRILNWFDNHKILAGIMGPIGWMILAADELIKHWNSVEHFFVHLADVVGGVFKDIERFLHIGNAASPGSASVTHHQVIEHVARAVRAAPGAARVFTGAAPLLAPAGAGVNGGIHFHVHMEGEASGVDADAQADSMLHALRTRQNDFVDVFSQINERAKGRWNSAGF